MTVGRLGWRRLVAISDLDARRRPGWWWAPVAWWGAGLAGAAWVHAAPTPARALTVLLASFFTLAITVPQAILWRADNAIIARLPIDGSALWGAALVRSLRWVGVMLVGWAPTVAVLALADAEVGVRHAAVGATLAVVAATLVPASTVWAAHLVASARVTAVTRAAGGDLAAPPSTLLGALPGIVGAGGLLLGLAMASWIAYARPPMIGPAWPWLAGTVVGSIALLWASRQVAPGLVLATREVAALDRQRLATLEIRPITGLEAVIARTVPAGPARAIYDKDARLMRRRYPMAWVVGIGVWLGALAARAEVGVTAAGAAPWLAGAGLGYAVLLAGRLRTAPIEPARGRVVAAIAPGLRLRAKLTWVVSWLVLFVAVPLLLVGSGLSIWLAGAVVLGGILVAGLRLRGRPSS